MPAEEATGTRLKLARVEKSICKSPRGPQRREEHTGRQLIVHARVTKNSIRACYLSLTTGGSGDEDYSTKSEGQQPRG